MILLKSYLLFVAPRHNRPLSALNSIFYSTVTVISSHKNSFFPQRGCLRRARASKNKATCMETRRSDRLREAELLPRGRLPSREERNPLFSRLCGESRVFSRQTHVAALFFPFFFDICIPFNILNILRSSVSLEGRNTTDWRSALLLDSLPHDGYANKQKKNHEELFLKKISNMFAERSVRLK